MHVARIERHVRHNDGAFQRRSRADDAVVRGHSKFLLHALPEFHRDAMAKYVVGVVIQQNRENLIVDQPLRQLGCAAQHFFHRKRGIRFAAHFVQQQQRLGLIALVLEELRVFDRRADARRHQRQNILLVGREIIRLAAFDIQHADRRARAPSAGRQVRSARLPRRSSSADRHAHRRRESAARGSGGADNSFRHRNPPVLHHFGAVADREPEIKLVGAFFGKQHSENFVVDQALDLRGRAGQNFVEVQRSVNFLRDFGEDRQRFRRNVDFGLSFAESIGCGERLSPR